MQGGQADLEAAKSRLANDPLGALTFLQTAAQRLATLQQRCGTALQQAEAAEKLDAQLQEAARLVQEQRSNGMRLTEEGGNPDPLLAAGGEQRKAAREALDAGRVEVAGNHVQQGVQAAEQAVAVVREQLEARRTCEQAIPEQRRESEQLGQLLNAGRAEHEQLEREFAPESWSDVAGHVKQAADALAAIDTLQRKAAEAAAADVQRYRQGRDLVQQIGEQQQQVRALFEQLHQRLDDLLRLREESKRQQQQMLQRAEEAQRWIAGHEHLIGNQARELLAVARSLQAKLDAGWGLNRPNWLQLREWLEQASTNYLAAFEQASDDVRTYEQFTSRLQTVQEETRRVERFLQSNTADRPRANQRLQAARQELGVLLGYETSGLRDWRDLQKRLDGVAADLQKAEQWAQEDIRIAQQAAAEIREAERAIDAASSFYEQGASADVSTAKSHLEQARRELLAQAYEQAIQKADQAELAARQSLAEAQSRADQRRRQRELEQRRRAAAATAVLPSIQIGHACQHPRPRPALLVLHFLGSFLVQWLQPGAAGRRR